MLKPHLFSRIAVTDSAAGAEAFLLCCTTGGGFQLVSMEPRHLATHRRFDHVMPKVRDLVDGAYPGEVLLGGDLKMDKWPQLRGMDRVGTGLEMVSTSGR